MQAVIAGTKRELDTSSCVTVSPPSLFCSKEKEAPFTTGLKMVLYMQPDPTDINCCIDYQFLEVQCSLGSGHYSSWTSVNGRKTEYYF